jgi:hypothetical protein
MSDVLTASEFHAIEHLLAERRYAYLNRRPKQPLIRLWDKNHDLIARIMIPESWDCEEKAHDDGDAHIELVGKDNDWLREIIVFKTRPAEDLHLTIDPDPDKPHDYKNRWGGKVTRIVDVEEHHHAGSDPQPPAPVQVQPRSHTTAAAGRTANQDVPLGWPRCLNVRNRDDGQHHSRLQPQRVLAGTPQHPGT